MNPIKVLKNVTPKMMELIDSIHARLEISNSNEDKLIQHLENISIQIGTLMKQINDIEREIKTTHPTPDFDSEARVQEENP